MAKRDYNPVRPYHMAENITIKQYQILTVLCEGNGIDPETGAVIPCDMDELLERLAYRTTKYSMQYSIRALTNRRMIEKGYCKRREANRVVYHPTTLARQIMGYGGMSFIEDVDLSYLDV